MNYTEFPHNAKPEISYPCEWEYRVIGESKEVLESLIFDIMPRQYRLEMGKESSSGRYVSLYVRLIVQSELERNELFSRLRAHKQVKMVL